MKSSGITRDNFSLQMDKGSRSLGSDNHLNFSSACLVRGQDNRNCRSPDPTVHP